MERALKYVIFGQISLFTFLLVCILLAPAALSANNGLSYFGVHIDTALPYSLALLLSGYWAFRASFELERIEPMRPLRLGLVSFLPLIAGILMTPYSFSNVFDWMHTFFGASLFIIQLLMSGWILLNLSHNLVNILLFLSELASGIVSLMYLAPSQGFLTQGQIAFQLAFGLLLVRSLAQRKRKAS